MKLSQASPSQLREAVEAERARELAPLSSAFKAATLRLVDAGRFF